MYSHLQKQKSPVWERRGTSYVIRLCKSSWFNSSPPPIHNDVKELKYVKWYEIFKESIDFVVEDYIKKEDSPNKKLILSDNKKEIKDTLQQMCYQIFKNVSKHNQEFPPTDNTAPAISEELIGTQFVTNLIALIEKNIKNDSIDGFKSLANELLEIAYPKKQNDEKLPPILRKLLQGEGIPLIPNWAFKFVTRVDVAEFKWDSLVGIFLQKYGKKIYETYHKQIKEVKRRRSRTAQRACRTL